MRVLGRSVWVMRCGKAFYKTVEEAVKALAMAKDLDKARRALRRRGWSTRLLNRAAARLGDVALRAWYAGYYLHVEGFHEARIGMEELGIAIPLIEPLIREVRRLLDEES